jgi:putative sterol carrier protein
MFNQELDDLWDVLKKPIIVTEFGAAAQVGLHGHPAVMWTEEYQSKFIRGYLAVASKKDFVAGMHIWNFADFAVVQSTQRVGGMNLKGVFTRSRQPKMAAHILREIWGQVIDIKPQIDSVDVASQSANATESLAPVASIQSVMENLARSMNGKIPYLNTTLKFDFFDDGVYRMIFENGSCHIESGDGEAVATMQVTWQDAQKLFTGKLNPMIAMMTGKIKTQGNARAFMFLLDV